MELVNKTQQEKCMVKNAVVLVLVFFSLVMSGQEVERDVYDALKAEKQWGLKVSRSSELLLDSIFSSAAESIDFGDSVCTKEEVLEVLQSFSILVEQHYGFIYSPVGTLAEAMDKRILDCNYNSLLFHTFFNRIRGYRLYPVLVPGHMFVRWYLNDTTWLNYETTSREFLSDDYYRKNFTVLPQPEEMGLYLKPLNDKQLTALHLAEVAHDVADTARALAIRLNRKALELDSTSFHVLRNLSRDFYFNGQKDSSGFYFSRALALDSMNYTVHIGRAEMFIENNEYEASLPWIGTAAQISPGNPNTYMLKCYAFLKMKSLEPAMAAFEEANRCIDKETIFTLLANYRFLAWLDQELILLMGE